MAHATLQVANPNFSDHLPWGLHRRFTAAQPVTADEIAVIPLTNADSADMNVDGSVTPVTFRARVPDGHIGLLLRAAFILQDDKDVFPGNFGGLPALTNGVTTRIIREGEVQIGEVFSFRTNADWFLMSGAANFSTFSEKNGGQAVLAWEWPIMDLGYVPVLSGNEPQDYVEVGIRDDLTGLERFRAAITVRLVPAT